MILISLILMSTGAFTLGWGTARGDGAIGFLGILMSLASILVQVLARA